MEEFDVLTECDLNFTILYCSQSPTSVHTFPFPGINILTCKKISEGTTSKSTPFVVSPQLINLSLFCHVKISRLASSSISCMQSFPGPICHVIVRMHANFAFANAKADSTTQVFTQHNSNSCKKTCNIKL
jgi:hypothetical protein